MTRSHFYYCKKDKVMKEGYPPDENKYYGEAPMVIFDSINKRYHPGLCREIESKQQWAQADKECGTITFGSREEARIKRDEANERKARKAEIRKASVAAWTAYKENPTEVSQRVAKEGEKQMETLKKAGLVNLLKSQGVKV